MPKRVKYAWVAEWLMAPDCKSGPNKVSTGVQIPLHAPWVYRIAAIAGACKVPARKRIVGSSPTAPTNSQLIRVGQLDH